MLPCSRPILDGRYSAHPLTLRFSHTRLSLSLAALFSALQLDRRGMECITSPASCPAGFELPLWGVQSPLLTPYQLVSFPGGTKMFQFPPCSFASFGGELFGNPRFNGCLRLPWAYRSLLRPSSLPEPSHPLNGILTALVFARNYSFYSTHGLINISHFIQEIFLNCI